MAMLATCNVWRSVEDCRTSADCGPGLTCNAEALRCVPAATVGNEGGIEASTPEAGTRCEDRPWGTPHLVPGLESEPIVSGRLSPDELTMFISRGVPPTLTDLYTVTRSTVRDRFRVVGPLPNVNEPLASEFWPTISADGKLLFFESSRSRFPDDAGVYTSETARVWSASRVNVASDFDKPKLQSLFDIASGAEAAPYLHPSGRSLYFSSITRPSKGQLDIWVAEINAVGVVTDVRNVEGVNSADEENAPVVSEDERFLYHSRTGAPGQKLDIFVGRRTTPADGFGRSILVPELSSQEDDYPTWVSPDHCRIYLSSSRPAPDDAGSGVFHMWVAERL